MNPYNCSKLQDGKMSMIKLIMNSNYQGYDAKGHEIFKHMKQLTKTLISLIIILSGSLQLIAQEGDKIEGSPDEGKFEAQLKSAIYTLYNANNLATFNVVSKRLKKISDENETEWLPLYHETYANVMAAFFSKEKFATEEYLNQAQISIDKAKILSEHNDEVHALQGFIHQARMINKTGVDVHKYAQLAVKEYDHARFLNPENPRPYYLIGQILYRLPPGFGGNKENACKHFIDGVEKYKSFKPKSELHPNWGEEANRRMLNNCK